MLRRFFRELASRGARSAPADVDALFKHALEEQRAGRLVEAVAGLRRAAEARPDSALYRLALGQALLDCGDAGQAIGPLEEAVRLAEGTELLSQSLLDLARALEGAQRREEAKECCRRILEREPGSAVALRSLAALLFDDGDVGEARGVAARCVQASADAASRLRLALMLPVIPGSIEEIAEARRRLDSELDALLAEPGHLSEPEQSIGRTPFYLAYHGENDRALMRKLAAVVRAAWREPSEFRVQARPPGRRLKVGFVSTFFTAHSVGKTSLGLIRDLPKDRFETFVFSLSPVPSPMAERIERSADHSVRLPARVDTARDAIAAAGLDALVFTDIGMTPVTYFLAFHRLAPLQITTWGHPDTSGIDTLDWYYSAASLESAGGEERYAERLVAPEVFFLPGYDRPVSPLVDRTRAALGLPDEGTLYLCPQSPFKLHPSFDGALAAILEADAGGRLLLLDWNAKWTGRLRDRLAPRLGRAMERVRFLPMAGTGEFIARYAAADVVLDPFVFGGCNTTFEALAMGAPVVSLPGTRLPGRFTRACYRELDIDDGIARDEDDYVERALRLAGDAEYRRSVSARILERVDALFGRRDATLALAEAIERHFGR